MFSKQVGVMLYVDDVLSEKAFWQAIGFQIVSSNNMMGYDSFEMVSHEDSTVTFTVFDKAFIAQVSPEVLTNVPSVLFQTEAIETLHERVRQHTHTASELNEQPFKHFNFSSPSGIYFAVRSL